MTNVFLITGNAGQGKTTFSVNFAYALSQYRDVLLMDADMNTPKIGYHFGMPLVDKTIQDVLLNKRSLREVIHEHPAGFKIIFSNISSTMEINPTILTKLAKYADNIVVDLPHIDESWSGFGRTIYVTTPDFPSVMTAHKILKGISNSLGIIINRSCNDAFELSPGNVQELLNKNVIGVIPEQRQCREVLKVGRPLIESYPLCKMSTITRDVAANLINKHIFTTEHGFLDTNRARSREGNTSKSTTSEIGSN